MEKISGILPANSRVTTVDLRSGGVGRAGGPNFGRQVGQSSVDRRKAEQLTAKTANAEFKNQMQVRNELNDPKVQIVQKMADNFFKTRLENAQKEVSVFQPEDSDMNIEIDAPSTNTEIVVDKKDKLPKLSTATIEIDDTEESADEASPAIGRYLDVQA